MYFFEGVENWNSRRILCLTKPFFSHFVDVLFTVVERSVVPYVVKLDLSLRSSARLIKTDVVPLSAFLMFISVLFFKSLSALRSAGGRLSLGFEICISAS